jgi:PAS domain S-box-containing protein
MPVDPVRVLLVEDDPEDYRLTRGLFAAIDRVTFKVDHAATYQAALEAMARQEYDVYLIDYGLGGHTGVELLRAARERRWPQPVILLTGPGDPDIDQEAVGADDYLSKGHIDAGLLERVLCHALERGRIARALRDSELRLRAVFEYTRDALVITEGEGQYCVEANPAACALFGLSRAQMIGRTLASFAAPGAEPQPVWRATAVGSQVTGEMRLVRQDGAHRHLEFVVTPNFLPGYDLSVLRDVTENRPGQAPTQQPPDRTPSVLGPPPTRPGLADLNLVVAGLAAALLRLLGETVELTLAFDPTPKPLRADAAQVEQVILDLAVRARDAMPAGGKLTLDTSTVEVGSAGPTPHPQLRPGPYALLQVRDTGRGLDEKARAQVEEAQAAGRRAREMGGVLAVYSDPSVGTCCALYLPRAAGGAVRPALPTGGPI